jgi:hypothetical protein
VIAIRSSARVYAVMNHLRFKEPIDRACSRTRRATSCQGCMLAGCEGFHVVQPADREAILVILGDSTATLDRVATDVGSPWMRDHVVPLLAGPPERHVGPIVTSTQYG